MEVHAVSVAVGMDVWMDCASKCQISYLYKHFGKDSLFLDGTM